MSQWFAPARIFHAIFWFAAGRLFTPSPSPTDALADSEPLTLRGAPGRIGGDFFVTRRGSEPSAWRSTGATPFRPAKSSPARAEAGYSRPAILDGDVLWNAEPNFFRR